MRDRHDTRGAAGGARQRETLEGAPVESGVGDGAAELLIEKILTRVVGVEQMAPEEAAKRIRAADVPQIERVVAG